MLLRDAVRPDQNRPHGAGARGSCNGSRSRTAPKPKSLRIEREEQLYAVEDIEDRYIPSWSTSIGVTESKNGTLGLSSNASSSGCGRPCSSVIVAASHRRVAHTQHIGRNRGAERTAPPPPSGRLSQPPQYSRSGFGTRLEGDKVRRVQRCKRKSTAERFATQPPA